jgi:demethylmenaquinone methyltransferase / 2-methoxy-6-polyprenyl-1,4-benzoquinol methylase
MGDNEKSRRVREMFGAIAGRYDFLNHFLSANIDRRWRRTCLREISKRIQISNPGILDLGCGTGDLSMLFSRIGPVAGCDFSHPMLQIAARKIKGNGMDRTVSLIEADALQLPFADASFDAVVSAFMLRNLADMDRGLHEMRRVLRPGGVMGVLEFGMPRNPAFSILYRWYFVSVLPKLGRMVSGIEGPYGYLPASVQAFPPIESLNRRVAQARFSNITGLQLTGGIAVLVIGEVADDK